MPYAAPVVNSNADHPRDRFTAICGDIFPAGALAAVHADDGKAYLACAASSGTDMPAKGFAAAGYSVGDVGCFVNEGWLGLDDSDIDPDDTLYVSDTPGQYSRTAGNTSQVVAVVYAKTDEAKIDFALATVEHPES